MALVEVVHHAGVASLTLNRPEARNALSIELCDAIVHALAEIDAHAEARVVMVLGAGRVFCAGADLAAVSGPGALKFLPAFERMLEAVTRHRLPTIAVIQGAALGGGFQLATVCDFRIAAHDATIGIPSPKLGILVNFENVQRLVLFAGIASAKEVLMAGHTYTGEEAAAAGLVTRAVRQEDIVDEARILAADLAALAPLSVQGAKKAINVVAGHLSNARTTRADATAEIDRLVAEAYNSADLSEGLRALGEKRQPRFEGK